MATNLARLRRNTGLSIRDVISAIPPESRGLLDANKLGKIEAGVRRATIDDLMALALALRVSPLVLLLPWPDPITPDAMREHQPPLGDAMVSGANQSLPFEEVWQWATGKRYPLRLVPDGRTSEASANVTMTCDPCFLTLLPDGSPEFLFDQPEYLRYMRQGDLVEMREGIIQQARDLLKQVDDWWPEFGEPLLPALCEPWSPGRRDRYTAELQAIADYRRLLHPGNFTPTKWDESSAYKTAIEAQQVLSAIEDLEPRARWIEKQLGVQRTVQGPGDPVLLRWNEHAVQITSFRP